MGLTVKIKDGWQGIVTGKVYYPPRECKESAEAQESQALAKRPLSLPTDCKPGSPEEAEYKAQEEALTNIERAQVRDTVVAYQAFCAAHPEYIQNDYNANQLCEYFQLKGVSFVQYNGSRVPLATSQEMWEEAYQWKMAMCVMQVDPTVMGAQERKKAQDAASEFFKHKAPTEEELAIKADEERSRKTGAWR